MGGGIPKPAQILEAVGDDSEGYRKDGSNSEGPGSNVLGGGVVCVTIWKRYLGGDRGNAQGTDGVPPLSGATDNGDDGETWGRRRVGVPRSRGGDGILWDPPHRSIHQEAADDHSGEGGLPACKCTVHRGGEDAGDEPDGALMG